MTQKQGIPKPTATEQMPPGLLLPTELNIQLPEFTIIEQVDVNQVFTVAFQHFIKVVDEMNICDKEILKDVEFLVTDYIERIEMQNDEIRNFKFDELIDNDSF